jgi:hypothetical protein
MVRGRLPISARVASLVVPICFILVLNAHFSNFEGIWQLVRRAHSWAGQTLKPADNHTSFIAPPINQARTPQGWLQRQDYKAAQEVINFVKPNAQRLVARVFDPLVIVIKGSNRSSSPSVAQTVAIWREILGRHIYAFLIALSLLLGVVTLVMHYLLWNEWPDGGESRPSITTKILPVAHGLDVYKLVGSNKAHMLSIAWDRSVVLYRFNLNAQCYTTLIIHNNVDSSYYCWPISCAAIDDTGTCIALADTTGSVVLHNVVERRESKRVTVQPWEKPVIFSMFRVSRTTPATSLIAVLPGGLLSIINVRSAEITFCLRLSLDILSARIVISEAGPEVMAASQSGELSVVPLIDGTTMQTLELALDSNSDGPVRSLVSVDSLDLCAVVQDWKVSLVDINTHLPVHQFEVPGMIPGSLRILHSPPRRCQICQALAVHMFSLAFTLEDRKTCAVRSFSLKSDDYNSNICLRPTTDDPSSCQTFKFATASFYDVPTPGVWESTNDDMLIGVRRAKAPTKPTTDRRPRDASSVTTTATPTALSPLMRESLRSPPRGGGGPPSAAHHQPLAWEVWTLSAATGELTTAPLPGRRDDPRAVAVGKPVLYAADAGPLARLGKRTVAVALGNVLHLVTAGEKRIEEAKEVDFGVGRRGRDSRMRRAGPGAKRKKKGL